jgi:hypothetical protein
MQSSATTWVFVMGITRLNLQINLRQLPQALSLIKTLTRPLIFTGNPFVLILSKHQRIS